MNCQHPTCDKPVSAKGLCHAHLIDAYNRWKNEQERNGRGCKTFGCTRVAQRSNLCRPCYDEARQVAPTPCTIASCEDNAIAKGLCNAHRQRKDRWGHPLGGPTSTSTVETCVADGCDRRDVHARDLCEPHYRRVLAAEKAGDDVQQALATPIKTRAPRSKPASCKVDGCATDVIHAKGMCQKHYNHHNYMQRTAKSEVNVAA